MTAADEPWGHFLNEVIAPKLVAVGWPSFEATRSLARPDDTTLLGGYSIIDADGFETAVSMATAPPRTRSRSVNRVPEEVG